MDQHSHPDSPSVADDGQPLRERTSAPLSRRAAARLVDGLILAVVASVATMLLGLDRSSPLGIETYLRTAITGVLTACLYLAYFAYFESGGRHTFGKRCLNIGVVGPGGRDLTMVQAVARNIWVAYGVAAVVPGIGSLLGGVASLAAVVTIVVGINSDTDDARGWHDRLAGGTRVVRR